MSDLSTKLLRQRAEPAMQVRFDTGFAIKATGLEKMQHRAHRYCFVADTLAGSVEITVM